MLERDLAARQVRREEHELQVREFRSTTAGKQKENPRFHKRFDLRRQTKPSERPNRNNETTSRRMKMKIP